MDDDLQQEETNLKPAAKKPVWNAIRNYSFFDALITCMFVNLILTNTGWEGVCLGMPVAWVVYLVIVTPVVLLYRKNNSPQKWEWAVGIFVPMVLFIFIVILTTPLF